MSFEHAAHTRICRGGFGLLHVERDRTRDAAIGSPALHKGDLYHFSFAVFGGGSGADDGNFAPFDRVIGQADSTCAALTLYFKARDAVAQIGGQGEGGAGARLPACKARGHAGKQGICAAGAGAMGGYHHFGGQRGGQAQC